MNALAVRNCIDLLASKITPNPEMILRSGDMA